MTTLMSVTFGQRALAQIELVLTRSDRAYTVTGEACPGSGCYTVAVNDGQGLLHLTEFPYASPAELLEANEQAMDWFDNVHEAINQYVSKSDSQAIKQLVETLH